MTDKTLKVRPGYGQLNPYTSQDSLTLEKLEKGKVYDITIHEGKRTSQQNKSLHVFCRGLAKTFNDAGMDQRKVYAEWKEGIEVPWTEEAVKKEIWTRFQKILCQKESTTELDTVEPSAIHQFLCQKLGETYGITVPPWPSRQNEGKTNGHG